MAQSAPEKPVSHSQTASVPLVLHRPCPEHLAGQPGSPHARPVQPGSHAHSPVPKSQVPCRLQAVVHSRPRQSLTPPGVSGPKPSRHSHTPSAMQSPFDSPPQSFGHVFEEQSRPVKLDSQVHVPLKHTPCEEQAFGQGDWPTAAPSSAKADNRQPERAGLLGRKAASLRRAEPEAAMRRGGKALE